MSKWEEANPNDGVTNEAEEFVAIRKKELGKRKNNNSNSSWELAKLSFEHIGF